MNSTSFSFVVLNSVMIIALKLVVAVGFVHFCIAVIGIIRMAVVFIVMIITTPDVASTSLHQ